MIDAIWGSDHRPVCSVFRLNLLPAYKRKAVFRMGNGCLGDEHPPCLQRTSLSNGSSQGPAITDMPSIGSPIVVHLEMSDFRLNLDSLESTNHNGSPSNPRFNRWVSSVSTVSEVEGETSECQEPPLPEVPPSLSPSTTNNSRAPMFSSTRGHISQLAVFFPLPSETCVETGTVKVLDSALSVEGEHSCTSAYLPGRTYVDWDVAKTQKGVRVATAILMPSPQGTLHALVKVIDHFGAPMAQGVIPVPR